MVRRESSVHAEQLYEIKIMTSVHIVGFNCDSYTYYYYSVAPLSKKSKRLPCCPPSGHILSHSSPVSNSHTFMSFSTSPFHLFLSLHFVGL